MKIAFCADCHIGNHKVLGGPTLRSMNRRCWDVLNTLERALNKAVEEQCDLFVIVGDLLDSTKPLPQMVAALIDLIKESSLDVIVIVGNHEHASTAELDHALAALRVVARVVETPTVVEKGDTALICIPCIPRHANEWFDNYVDNLAKSLDNTNRNRILCFHLGVADNNTPPYLQGAKDSIRVDRVLAACERNNLKAAIAGNWHNQHVWQNRVYQLGALAPTGFDNPGLEGYGGLAIYDSSAKSVCLYEIVGPRFLLLNTADTDACVKTGAQALHSVYVRITSAPDTMLTAQAKLAEYRSARLIVDGMVVPDKKAQQIVARRVAHVVKEARSLQEAIVEAVAAETLPEGADPQSVIQRLSRYLAV